MNYSFPTIASRAVATALFFTVVSMGSAMPAAASPSSDARAVVTVCPPKSIVSTAEEMLEALFFATPDPCAQATSAGASHDATITGPVHPITEFLRELI